jgi:hypothetical protein
MPRTKGAKDLKPRARKKKKEPTTRIRVPLSLLDKIKDFIKQLISKHEKAN